MGYNIGPKIGIEGESEFRNQIKKINAEYKTLEAETRAVTAAFEKNGDEQGKLEAITKQLEKQIDKQKQKMSLLEDAVKKATEKFGEESTEANRLRGVLYDTQATVSKLEGSLDDARRQLDETGDAMEDFGDETDKAGDAAMEFEDVLGAAFLANIATDIVGSLTDAVIDFAKGSIEAAAEVKASNAQMEQTFIGMEKNASQALEAIEDTTGITTTRIQDSFTKLFAFAKTSGADAEEALNLSQRAMAAAADSAAYYDKTVEEAAETLQSFLKGNYANDAALGIAATETTRNAKANELYAKSFKELSESQKVDVLLAMVEAGNAASGALGQAAREADSWTNVTGEAAETVRQLQAAVGEPALEEMIPIIQGITESLKGLLEVSDWESLNNSIGDFNDAMQRANTEYEESTAKTESTALAAAEYVERLRDLEAAGLDTAQAQYDYKRIVGELNSLIPTLNLTIDEQTGLLIENKDAILNDIKAWSKMSATSSYQRKLQQQSEALGDAELAVYEAQYKLTGLQEDATKIESDLAKKSAELAKAEEELSHCVQRCGDSAYAAAASSSEETTRYKELEAQCASLSDEVYDLHLAQQANKSEQDALNDAIQSGKETVSQYEEEIKAVSEAMDKFGQSSEEVETGHAELQTKIESTQAAVDELCNAYDTAKEDAWESLSVQIGLFDEIATKSDWSAEKVIKNWESQQRAFYNYSANLQKAVDMGLDTALVQQLSDGTQESMQLLDALVNDTEISIDEINAAFRGLSASKDNTSEVLAEIKTGFSNTMDELTADAKDAGLDIVDGVVLGIDNNAYKLKNAMKRLGQKGIDAVEVAFDINSPSRVMQDDAAYVVDGAVLGIDRNVSDFEAAMERMAFAGRDAYVQAQLSRAEDYPILYSPAVQPTGGGTNYTRHYGGFNIQIHQQPGQSPDDLVDVLMDRIQTLVDSKEAGL